MERMTTRALILPMGLVRCFNLLFLTWYEFNVLLGLVDDGVTVRKEQEDKGIGILLHFNFFSLYEDSMLLGSDGKKEIHDKQKIDSSSAPGGLGSDSLGGGSSSGGRGSGSRSGSVFPAGVFLFFPELSSSSVAVTVTDGFDKLAFATLESF